MSNEPQPKTQENRSHLFISYATEDGTLAQWLARKLAALGYAVWFDQIKMLGGEPWPQTIDDAIKKRTFRMLGLISAHSLKKPKPTGERVLAQKVGEKLGIPDFLIPLKVDGTELDWLTTAISYVPFNRGWAGGFRQLMAKLASINAPKALQNASSLAASTFPTGDDLVAPIPEELKANVIRVDQVPTALRVFKLLDPLDDAEETKLQNTWAFYRTEDVLLAFVSPPAEFRRFIQETKEAWSWVDCETIRGVRSRDAVANLIMKSIKGRVIRSGAFVHPKRNETVYLPEKFSPDGWLRFTDFRGKVSRLKIRGKATFKRPGKPPEVNHHHFAFRLRLGRGLDKGFWVQITPTLFFFDETDNAITDDRVGPRRRRVTKSWFNAKWVNRLLAAEQLLLGLQSKATDGIVLQGGLHSLEAPVRIDEASLGHQPGTDSTATDEVEPEAEFTLEEEKGEEGLIDE